MTKSGFLLMLLSLVLLGCGAGSSSSPVPVAMKKDRLDIFVPDIEAVFSEELIVPSLAENVVGDLEFVLVEGEARDVVLVDAKTGRLKVINPGLVHIKVTDTSSVYKTSAHTYQVYIDKTKNNKLSSDELVVSEKSSKFNKLVVRNYYGKLTYRLSSLRENIIELNANGMIQSLGKSGIQNVIVRDSGNRRYLPTEIEAKVKVLKGERNQIVVNNKKFNYAKDYVIIPDIKNVKGKVIYRILEGHDVLNIVNNNFRIKGVGQVRIEAYDDGGESYKQSKQEFIYQVNQLKNSELVDSSIHEVYRTGLVLKFKKGSFKGDISFEGIDNSLLKINGESLEVLKPGKSKITIIDSGGLFYKKKAVSYLINVKKGVHPEIKTKSMNLVYGDYSCVNIFAYIEGVNGSVEVVNNSDDSVVLFNEYDQCFQLYEAGSALVRFKALETEYYLSSPEVILPINILRSNSRSIISLLDSEGDYYPGGLIHSPGGISHQKGDLLYKILAGQDEDVVSVDPKKGTLRILNSGETIVVVTDYGGRNYLPSSTTFKVTINRSKRELDLTYASTVYEKGKIILPNKFSNDRTYSFSNSQEKVPSVELVDASKGMLKINKAGISTIEVSEQSRNYYSETKSIPVVVEKVPHPGLKKENETITLSYKPKSIFNLEEGIDGALGRRSYAIAAGSTRDLFNIDPVSGEITINDYDEALSSRLVIRETESENYLPMEVSVNVKVLLSDYSGVDSQVEIDRLHTIIPSKLNVPRFSNLKSETSFNVSGVRKALVPSSAEVAKYGQGMKVLISMTKKGEADIRKTKAIIAYIRRYDGCSRDYNIQSLAAAKSIPILSSGLCSGNNEVNRYFTITLLDDTALDSGDWSSSQFSIYRYSDIQFSASDFGGSYVDDRSSVIGGNPDEPVNLLEWHLAKINLNVM